MRIPKHDLTSILIPFVYFIAGAASLAGIATTYFYKDDLRLTIVQAQIIGSMALVPWSIKPLYGLLSDRVPVFGMRRKPYLVLAGALGSAGYLSLAFLVHSFSGAVIATLVSGAGFALADVIVDGIVAERSRTQREAGKLQSICRGALMFGALLVAYLSGILVEWFGPRIVLTITGVLPLCTSILALIIVEGPVPSEVGRTIRETWKAIRKALTPAILWSALFLFVWRSTPNSGGSLTYYMIDVLQFDPEFLGRLSLISSVAGIVGIVIFRKFLISIPLKKLLFWIVIASVVLSLPSIGLVYGWYEVIGVSPKFFAMADTLISGPLSEIGFLPLLVLVARVCPPGIEATMFAILASLMNIGLGVSDLGGAWLVHTFDIRQAADPLGANYQSIDAVLWIAILSSFLPLPFLPFLPETRSKEEYPSPPDCSPSAQRKNVGPLKQEKSDIA